MTTLALGDLEYFLIGIGVGAMVLLASLQLWHRCFWPCMFAAECFKSWLPGLYKPKGSKQKSKKQKAELSCCACVCGDKGSCVCDMCGICPSWSQFEAHVAECCRCHLCCPVDVEEKKGPVALANIDLEDLENDFVDSGVIEDICIVVAIDMTRSNTFKGRQCFGGNNLHNIDDSVNAKDLHRQQNKREASYHPNLNPYEHAILASEFFLTCDTDGGFPLYYFGSVQAAEVGGYIQAKDSNCEDVHDLWETYRKTVKGQEQSGPGRLTPLYERCVERTKLLGRYHILLVFTDGDVEDHKELQEALAKASKDVPLSLVIVGIGDGPFNQASMFDDDMTGGKLIDTMQFVDFSKVNKAQSWEKQQEEFFTLAFNEIPRQYREMKEKQGYRAPMRRAGEFAEHVCMEPVNTDDFEKEEKGSGKMKLGVKRAAEAGGGGQYGHN